VNNTIFIVLVSIPVVGFVLEQFLVYLNKTMWSNEVPVILRGICPVKEYRNSQLYNKEKYSLNFWSSLFNLLTILAMVILGGFAIVDGWARELGGDKMVLVTVIFFAILGFGSGIIDIPFSYIQTFIIEKKYGFNTMSQKTYFWDIIKTGLLTFFIGVPILGFVTWLYFKLGSSFWIYTWIFLTIISLFANFFYSDLIVPIFNKQLPLEAGSLRTRIEAFAKSSGFEVKDIYVIDGSKRSTKSNAYFSGIGPKKRIVLYDTLIKEFSEEEIVAVLGHEIGHYLKRHILLSMFISFFMNGLMLFLFSMIVDHPAFSLALGTETASFHMGLIVFGILYSPLSIVLDLLVNYISRKNEYTADKYSSEHYDPDYLASALKKLSIKNLSNMTPHPVYVFFYYSHPPLLKRLERLK